MSVSSNYYLIVKAEELISGHDELNIENYRGVKKQFNNSLKACAVIHTRPSNP